MLGYVDCCRRAMSSKPPNTIGSDDLFKPCAVRAAAANVVARITMTAVNIPNRIKITEGYDSQAHRTATHVIVSSIRPAAGSLHPRAPSCLTCTFKASPAQMWPEGLGAGGALCHDSMGSSLRQRTALQLRLGGQQPGDAADDGEATKQTAWILTILQSSVEAISAI